VCQIDDSCGYDFTLHPNAVDLEGLAGFLQSLGHGVDGVRVECGSLVGIGAYSAWLGNPQCSAAHLIFHEIIPAVWRRPRGLCSTFRLGFREGQHAGRGIEHSPTSARYRAVPPCGNFLRIASSEPGRPASSRRWRRRWLFFQGPRTRHGGLGARHAVSAQCACIQCSRSRRLIDCVVGHPVERLPERRHRFLARGAAAIGHAVALVATKSPGAQTTRRGSATSVTRAREPGKRR